MNAAFKGGLTHRGLDVGGGAIFVPAWTDRGTGWREGDSYFCYADLADFYLSEGTRFVFADAADGLAFDRSTYPELAEAESLDKAAAYIREQIREADPNRRVIIGEGKGLESGGYVFVEGTEET